MISCLFGYVTNSGILLNPTQKQKNAVLFL